MKAVALLLWGNGVCLPGVYKGSQQTFTRSALFLLPGFDPADTWTFAMLAVQSSLIGLEPLGKVT